MLSSTSANSLGKARALKGHVMSIKVSIMIGASLAPLEKEPDATYTGEMEGMPSARMTEEEEEIALSWTGMEEEAAEANAKAQSTKNSTVVRHLFIVVEVSRIYRPVVDD